MSEKEINVRIPTQGMTCAGCEDHVINALNSIGAKNVTASFRKGEATFQVEEKSDIEKAKKAIADTGYMPGEAEIISSERKPELSQEGDYDLLIIGSGGAAFSAAIEAVGQGAKVAMVERGTIGGTCVNIGCVPSKTLLRAGEINHLARMNPFLGLDISAGPVDLATLVNKKNELVDNMRQEKYVNLIDDYGFDLIQGEAKFLDENTVEVDGRKITAKSFFISTGASPQVPDIEGLKEVDFLTSTTALELKELPKRLAVIGSGYIAMELGQLFHNLGSEVTLIQRSPRILKTYDPEISEAVTEALTEQGISLITGATYERVEKDGDVKRIHIVVNGEKQVIEAEQLLVATGRKPNTAALNLDAAGVKVGSREEVIIDEYLRTSNPRIFAAGDVTMGPQFVYVAAYEGGVAARNALAVTEQKIDLRFVPGVTFTNPSIATVGLTEEQAKAEGYEVKTSVLPLDAVPRALVNRETTGVFKLIADAKTLKVLGVHIVAENAGDVIYAGTLAVKFGLTVQDLRESLAPYLTMAEGLKLAALTFDKDVSKLSCCAG
ncbi:MULTISPECIES: mercury(II) reductase [Bacillaceae]|uniref:Mercuric reductase n=1 Tax=Cytobacillus horneckiae TaxID=549687 RepID=A0A2N0ZAM8_9BACI|nr:MULTISPECIES: mercury(II) reductase [Bacillaceae]MEC1158919.1 mercury(II) reductase [Cytobacillus horneckiae]PKG26555.1 mercury(II) reductase [Cytobacillus horneckiae]TES50333.1 mercury(II) reductase [Halalkalibacterium halodurans]